MAKNIRAKSLARAGHEERLDQIYQQEELAIDEALCTGACLNQKFLENKRSQEYCREVMGSTLTLIDDEKMCSICEIYYRLASTITEYKSCLIFQIL